MLNINTDLYQDNINLFLTGKNLTIATEHFLLHTQDIIHSALISSDFETIYNILPVINSKRFRDKVDSKWYSEFFKDYVRIIHNECNYKAYISLLSHDYILSNINPAFFVTAPCNLISDHEDEYLDLLHNSIQLKKFYKNHLEQILHHLYNNYKIESLNSIITRVDSYELKIQLLPALVAKIIYSERRNDMVILEKIPNLYNHISDDLAHTDGQIMLHARIYYWYEYATEFATLKEIIDQYKEDVNIGWHFSRLIPNINKCLINHIINNPNSSTKCFNEVLTLLLKIAITRIISPQALLNDFISKARNLTINYNTVIENINTIINSNSEIQNKICSNPTALINFYLQLDEQDSANILSHLALLLAHKSKLQDNINIENMCYDYLLYKNNGYKIIEMMLGDNILANYMLKDISKLGKVISEANLLSNHESQFMILILNTPYLASESELSLQLILACINNNKPKLLDEILTHEVFKSNCNKNIISVITALFRHNDDNVSRFLKNSVINTIMQQPFSNKVGQEALQGRILGAFSATDKIDDATYNGVIKKSEIISNTLQNINNIYHENHVCCAIFNSEAGKKLLALYLQQLQSVEEIKGYIRISGDKGRKEILQEKINSLNKYQYEINNIFNNKYFSFLSPGNYGETYSNNDSKIFQEINLITKILTTEFNININKFIASRACTKFLKSMNVNAIEEMLIIVRQNLKQDYKFNSFASFIADKVEIMHVSLDRLLTIKNNSKFNFLSIEEIVNYFNIDPVGFLVECEIKDDILLSAVNLVSCVQHRRSLLDYFKSESSMNTWLLKRANNIFPDIEKKYYQVFKTYGEDNEERIENIYFLIRKEILIKILQNVNLASEDRLYLKENLNNIAYGWELGLNKVRKIFIGDNYLYDAWRALDTGAKLIDNGWPNLLLKTIDPASNIEVFSTVESLPLSSSHLSENLLALSSDYSLESTGSILLNDAQEICRYRLAYYYLVATDDSYANVEERINIMLHILADFANANGKHIFACYPGTIGFLANMGVGNDIAKLPSSGTDLIINQMQSTIYTQFKEELLKCNNEIERLKLHYALTGLNISTVENIIKKPELVEYTDEMIKQRQQFISKVAADLDTGLEDKIIATLPEFQFTEEHLTIIEMQLLDLTMFGMKVKFDAALNSFKSETLLNQLNREFVSTSITTQLDNMRDTTTVDEEKNVQKQVLGNSPKSN